MDEGAGCIRRTQPSLGLLDVLVPVAQTAGVEDVEAKR